MDSNSEEGDDIKPTFRIRFTISNRSQSTNDNRNVEHCDHSTFDSEDRANQCNHQINKNHHRDLSEPHAKNKVKLFKFVEPQNHKSALFVNLGNNISNNSHQQKQGEKQLFISPDLNNHEDDLPEDKYYYNIDSNQSSDFKETMNGSCNFIHSWLSANRRRASSATPPTQANTNSSRNNNTHAVSTDNLVAPQRSASETTVCDGDYVQLPLEIEVDSPISDLSQPDDILQVDLDNLSQSDDKLHVDMDNLNHANDILKEYDLSYEEECRRLEEKVEYWEQKIAELERKRFADDVSRTLVESIIKQRREIRELEFQLCKQNLEQSAASKFGSQIKPGQENTADILNAVPPSGSLQHRQYLSNIHRHPQQYQEQRHVYQDHQHHSSRHVSRRREHQVYVQLGNHLADRKIMPDDASSRLRSSPIRPNHFKDDFRSAQVIISQDSSSTASSSSPH